MRFSDFIVCTKVCSLALDRRAEGDFFLAPRTIQVGLKCVACFFVRAPTPIYRYLAEAAHSLPTPKFPSRHYHPLLLIPVTSLRHVKSYIQIQRKVRCSQRPKL